MENTFENYVKFLGHFFNHKISVYYPELKKSFDCRFVGIHNTESLQFECPEGMGNYDFIEDGEICPVILKPLTEVTDQHAKELSYRMGKVISLDEIIQESSIDLVKKVIENYTAVDALWMLPARFADKAREYGYAIDWNEVSVRRQIEYGWVKLKSINEM